MHVLTQIRDAIASALSGISANVYVDRLYQLSKSDLPCVVLSVGDESAQPMAYGDGITLERSAYISVIICVANNGDFDALANGIQSEVETALAQDASLGGLVTSIKYVSRVKSTDAGGDVKFIRVDMNYLASFRTKDNAPTISI